MYDPPLPPLRCVGWPWFFSELPGFFLGIGSGWSGFWVAFFVGRLFHGWMCDPPLCFFLVVVGEGLGFLLGVAAGAEVEGDAGFFEGVEGGDGVGDVDGCFLGALVCFVEFLGEFLGCGVVVGGLEVLEWELGVEWHVVVAVEVLCVDDVSVDAVSPCVVELVAGLVEDAVDVVGDDGVVVVEGPVIVHQDGNHSGGFDLAVDNLGGRILALHIKSAGDFYPN